MTFKFIPQPTDFLSDSQNDILNNFTVSNAVMAINHYPFNDLTANKGKHKFVELVNNVAPAGVAGEGIAYTKTIGAASELFYKPDATVNEYQITRTITASFASFATNPGWIFLPGGLLLQFGAINAPGGGPTVVTFPVSFTSAPYIVELTPRNDGAHSAFNYWIDGAPVAASFSFRGSTTGSQTLFWMALGK